MNRFLVLAEVLFDVEKFLAIIALQIWRLMVNHMSLEIAQRVEDLSAFVAWYFLLRSMNVIDVISQSRIAVEAFLAM